MTLQHTKSALLPPPWYRQFWPWMLIAIPAVSVLLGIVMIVLASVGQDALVVDDWYKEGKGINQRIARDREATRLGLAARIDTSRDAVILDLAAESATFVAPAMLDVRWVHVTQSERDGAAQFAHAGGGRYVASGPGLPADGRWRIHVAPVGTDTWRLVSETVLLAPGSKLQLAARK